MEYTLRTVWLKLPVEMENMGMPGLPELLLIFSVVVLLFGASKIPRLFGAFGEGIKNFKKGIRSDSDENGAKIEDSDHHHDSKGNQNKDA